MKYNKAALAAAAATLAKAQEGRPEDVSICDYYTKALLEENTAENQATLLTLVVNTVVIGNYTEPNVGIMVPGILAPGNVDGEDVELLPYFDGTLASTNTGGSEGEMVNFLDDGGAEPLKENKPSNTEDSRQYFLLTHLYQFFGALLGCSEQGMPGFDAYTANPSMFEVHKFMNLNKAEMDYFIQNVGTAATSLGVTEADAMAVGEALNSLFNVRCAPATEVIPGQGEELQSICIDEETCPLSENADCDAYKMGNGGDECGDHEDMPEDGHEDCDMPPGGGNSTMTSSMPAPTEGTPTDMPTDGMPGSPTEAPTSVPTAGAATVGFSLAAMVAGLAAFAL